MNEQSFANGDFSKLRSSGERTVRFCKWHEMNCNELRPRAHGKPLYALTFPCKSVTLLTMGFPGKEAGKYGFRPVFENPSIHNNYLFYDE